MSDSEDKKSPQALPITPPEGTSLVIIRNKDGSTREALRNKNGSFVKKPKPIIPSVEFTRKERKILYGPSKTKEGLSEHEVAFRNILSIAQNTDTDPKAMMAAVKAYEIVMRRALGKEAPSDQELDKMERQPVTAIFVQAPQIMNPEVIDADKVVEKKKKPDFAEVLGVVTNEK
jgi:hypothetical protein